MVGSGEIQEVFMTPFVFRNRSTMRVTEEFGKKSDNILTFYSIF